MNQIKIGKFISECRKGKNMTQAQLAGYYECRECNYKYVPSYNSVLFAMHTGRTRYMKCHHFGKKSWQKKVISK